MSSTSGKHFKFICIPAHPPSLRPPRPAICIFYLVLRALDTIEDDMTIPATKKVTLLKEFHTHLHQPGWRYTESREKDRVVLEEFPAVSDPASLCVIKQQKISFNDISQREDSSLIPVSPYCKSRNTVVQGYENDAVMFYHLVAKRINQVKLS